MKKCIKMILGLSIAVLVSACTNGSSNNPVIQISGPATAALGVKGPSIPLNISVNSASLSGTLSIGTTSSSVIDSIQVTNISPAAPGLTASGCIGSGTSCTITLNSNGSVTPTTYTLTIQGTNTSAVTTRLTVAYPKLSLSGSVMTKTSQSITLTNSSTVAVPLDVTSLAASAAGWSISANTCVGNTLAKGQSCTFTVNSANTNPRVVSNINIAGNYFSASPYTPIPTITTVAAPSTINYTAPGQANGGTIAFTQQDVTFQVQNTSTDPTAISIPVSLSYDSGFAGGLTVNTSGGCTAGSGGINYYVPANNTCSITLHATDIITPVPTPGSQFTFTVGFNKYIYNLTVPGITGSASIASDHSTDGAAAYEKIEVTNNTNNTISNLALNFSGSVSGLIENAAPSTSGQSATNCPTGSSNPLASGATCYFWLHALQQNHPTITTGSGLTISVLYTEGGTGEQTTALPIVAATYLYAAGNNGVYAWDGNSNDNWQTLATIGNGMYGQTLLADPITGNLYAGGKFDSLTVPNQNPTVTNNLAYWDGYTWQPGWQGLGGTGLGKDANAPGVYALAETATGTLYAGGNINNSSGTTYVASINTAAVTPSWSDMSGSLNGQVNALTLDGLNNLDAGGSFSLFVATFTGGAWNALSSPSTIGQAFSAGTGSQLSAIYALLFNNSTSQLLATAASTTIFTGGIMTWNDSTTGWLYNNVYFGAGNAPYSITKFNGDIYVGDIAAQSVDKMVGRDTIPIVFVGNNSVPSSLYADNNNLYVGVYNPDDSSAGIYTVNVSNSTISAVSNNITDSINSITEGPYLCVGGTSTCPAN